jgi:pimeloyl-ACP methyl ester carboxylesterase
MTTLSEVSLFKTDGGRARFMEAYNAIVGAWPTPCEELDIDTCIGRTHIIASGPKDASPLFLLHSMAGTATSWVLNVAALSQHFRVYAVDTPGQSGKSIASAPVRTRAQMATWFTDLLDKLGHSRASIAGCSHGGFLAMSQASLTPDRVDKVVLISPAGTFVPLSLGFIFGMLVKAPLRRVIKKERKRDIADMLGSNGHINPGWRNLMAISMETSARPQLASPVPLRPSELAAIRTPVLLLIGDGERLYDPAGTIGIAKRRVPNLTGEVIPNAHHIGAMANADFVNTRMVAFLKPG